VSSVNWLSIYLAIELQTLTLFILAALKRDSAYSTEAGLKYFVLGAVSSGVFLFGCAGIGHIGFILFGVAIGSFESIQASLIYLIIYVIMSICSFSIILSLKLTKDLIIEVSGLSRDNPVMALTLALTLLSTAGVPPLAGFLSK